MRRVMVRRRGVLAAVAVCSIVGAACSNSATSDTTQRDATGEVVGDGRVGAFRLQVGDCIEEDAGDGVFDSLPVVPCDEPHQLEIYHAFDLADGAWPGEAGVEQRAAEGCLAAFRDFVGIDFAQSVFDVVPIRPTQQSWEEIDDREVLCALFELDGSLMTGTARGAAR